MARRIKHPMDAKRDLDLALIKEIADRAVFVYSENGVRADLVTIIMDLTACHFSGCGLRLFDLSGTDTFNLMHDVGGINRHLNRDTYELMDGFTPRFAEKRAKP